MMRVGRHWCKKLLPGEVLHTPSLEVPKDRLAGALGNLIQWKEWGRWTRWSLKVPSNPNHSKILWFYNSIFTVVEQNQSILFYSTKMLLFLGKCLFCSLLIFSKYVGVKKNPVQTVFSIKTLLRVTALKVQNLWNHR